MQSVAIVEHATGVPAVFAVRYCRPCRVGVAAKASRRQSSHHERQRQR